MPKVQPFYAVAKGRVPGIYRTWDAATKQVTGVSNPVFKKFNKEKDAISFIAQHKTPVSNVACKKDNNFKEEESIDFTAKQKKASASTTMDCLAMAPKAPPWPKSNDKRVASPAPAAPSWPKSCVAACIERISESQAAAHMGRSVAIPPTRNRSYDSLASSCMLLENSTYRDPMELPVESPIVVSAPLNMSSSHHGRLIFDGGSRKNPGLGGSAAVLYKDSPLHIGSVRIRIDYATNNEAEYIGLILGMQLAKQCGVQQLDIEGDSKIVIQQMNGDWKVKSENLKPLYEVAASLKARFDSCNISWIPRAKNFAADRLIRIAMDDEYASSCKSSSDFMSVFQDWTDSCNETRKKRRIDSI